MRYLIHTVTIFHCMIFVALMTNCVYGQEWQSPLTGTILLIVITLITYQENPEVKEVIKQEDLLMEWNPEKLILTKFRVFGKRTHVFETF